jgi:hypothetical protein
VRRSGDFESFSEFFKRVSERILNPCKDFDFEDNGELISEGNVDVIVALIMSIRKSDFESRIEAAKTLLSISYSSLDDSQEELICGLADVLETLLSTAYVPVQEIAACLAAKVADNRSLHRIFDSQVCHSLVENLHAEPKVTREIARCLSTISNSRKSQLVKYLPILQQQCFDSDDKQTQYWLQRAIQRVH